MELRMSYDDCLAFIPAFSYQEEISLKATATLYMLCAQSYVKINLAAFISSPMHSHDFKTCEAPK